MKKYKYLMVLFVITISLTGCFGSVNNSEQQVKNSNKQISEYEYEPLTLDMFIEDTNTLTKDEKKSVQRIIDDINKLHKSNLYNDEQLNRLYDNLDKKFEALGYDMNLEGEEDLSYEPITLKSFLGFDYDKLSDEQVQLAQVEFDKVFGENSSELTCTLQNDGLDEFYKLLKSFGLKVPYLDFETFLSDNTDKFTKEQRQEMLVLYKEYSESFDEGVQNKEVEEKLESYLLEAGYDFDSILEQLEMRSVEYAKFTFDDSKLKIVGTVNQKNNVDLKKFKYIIDRAIKIIPDSMEKYINHFIINTDGKDNVLAYVSQENDTLTKWRMVLDINDAFNEDNNYIDDFDQTIVHEFAHILTLNNTQIQSKSIGTYEVDEGKTTPNSYLNLFYQKFWSPIIEDYNELSIDSSDDLSYEFYDKYADQFVSDYAATNPGEDIAETFRVFVFGDKPTGNTIKDQKVLWMYSFKELVNMRQVIRNNLEL